MNAQPNISLPSAQNIVSQLVDIAKANNAMDVIGSSTSWRWQEGLISRMPKTRTVATILTKAFRSDDPRDWLSKVPEDLRWFIKLNILKEEEFDIVSSFEVSDVYEAYFLNTWFTGETDREEILFGLCYFKYASTIDDIIEQYETPCFNKVRSLFDGWAKKKFDDCILKFDLGSIEDKYKQFWSQFFNTESFTRKISELAILQNKIVGFTSINDMWKSTTFRVTDEEHIKIELEIKAFYDNLRVKYASERELPTGSLTGLRTYTFTAITYPTTKGAK